ncbi:MAG: hypothetical protein LUG99_14845 [Lachnospiraceae bacterium]|nr:hypothetical protein [Lachnospiraceae bacterium]
MQEMECTIERYAMQEIECTAENPEVRLMMHFNNSKTKQRVAAVIVIVIIVAMVLGTIVSALAM